MYKVFIKVIEEDICWIIWNVSLLEEKYVFFDIYFFCNKLNFKYFKLIIYCGIKL